MTDEEIELQNAKVAGMFELDTNRIKSMAQLREALELDGAMKVYPQLDPSMKGRLLAATQFENATGTEPVLIQIDVTANPKQCILIILCNNPEFRSVVAGSILDIISKTK